LSAVAQLIGCETVTETVGHEVSIIDEGSQDPHKVKALERSS
jgi:hypothetical protein